MGRLLWKQVLEWVLVSLRFYICYYLFALDELPLGVFSLRYRSVLALFHVSLKVKGEIRVVRLYK